MRQTWTLNVEDFGKIREASIEIKPFMIFAGDNNTGKSYLMSLVWGLLNVGEQLFWEPDLTLDSVQRCMKWFEESLSKMDGTTLIVDEEGQKLFINWLNDVLAARKDWLVSRIFNRKTTVGRIFISDFKFDNLPCVDINEFVHMSIMTFTSRVYNKLSSGERYGILVNLCLNVFAKDFYNDFSGPTYLPASRTGFMMTYRSLIRDALHRGYSGDFNGESSKQKTTLNWPTNYFLQELTSLDLVSDSKFDTVAKYLESEVLGGEITREDTPVPTYRYRPFGSQDELPFHATSSLVSELAPFVLYLKADTVLNALIIEEPEAHLHLKMQKKMAVALVRLVNAGLPVWITTHSDTLTQQLNNLIQLYQHPRRQELASQFGYERNDFLDPNMAIVYQFTSEDTGTKIEKLPLTSGGFAFPTFTNSILDQAKQTMAFEEEIEDDDHE